MRYRDLKDERDEAVARMLEAERLSMKSEFDRVTAEFEREKSELLTCWALRVPTLDEAGLRAGKMEWTPNSAPPTRIVTSPR